MPKPTTAKTWPEFATYRDNPEGMSLARELAEARGVTISGLLRVLVREEHRRATRREKREEDR
jgi:hypothetical protein